MDGRQKLSFFEILCSFFLRFGKDSPTATRTQHPQVPGTSDEAAVISIRPPTDPGENRRTDSRSTPRTMPEPDPGENRRSNSRSALRILTDHILPLTICTGTLFSIPAQVYDRQHEFPMLEPLLASIILGILVSFWLIFLDLQRSQPAAIEAQTVELNEEEFQSMELKKVTLLKIGLIFSLLAILLRVMLPLSWTFSGRLAVICFAGSAATAVGLHFYIGFVPP